MDELLEKIRNAPITPKPSVDHLWYTWDWASFIKIHMEELKNHSFYNAFQFHKEKGSVKMRYKKLPHDLEWKPPTGIKLISENVDFSPVTAEEFRVVEDLKLDEIFKSVNKYLSTMTYSDRIKVSNSWDRVRETLESLPRRRPNLPTMKLLELPKQEKQIPDLPEGLPDLDQEVPDLVGEVFPAELEESDFSNSIVVDMDVVVYTKSKSRPWVGRVVEVLPNGKFILQWFSRRSRSKTFYAMLNKDGSKFVSEEECDAVMLWEMSIDKTETSFVLTEYWLKKIQEEYENHDQCY